MNQVAKINGGGVMAPVSETTAMIGMIERAARDPSVDIDKMRELLAMRKEIMAMDAEQAFNAAMTDAQSEMRSIAADSNNPQTRSKYASYHAIDKAIRPIYTKHGFSLSFDTAEGAPDQHVRVVCFVAHRLGHSRKYHVDMPADGKGAKGGDVMTKTHAVGSGMSYGQRYLVKMIWNLSVGEDDDGNKASAGDRITEDQAIKLRELIESVGAEEPKVCGVFRVERLIDLPAGKYDEAVTRLNEYGKRNKGQA